MSTYAERRAARHARIAELIAAKRGEQMICCPPPAAPEPAPMPAAPPPAVIVREFSAAGPCLTIGMLVRETANFYVYLEWKGGDRYGNEERLISKPKTHIEPCHSCRDHAQSSYPNGYMD